MALMKAITGGSVFDSERSRFLPDAVVLVDKGVILRVGSRGEITIPVDAETLPADGAFVVPGLIDAHNHLCLDSARRSFEEASLRPVSELVSNGITNAQRQLRDGVTTLRDCGTPGFADLQVRDSIADGTYSGPRLVCAGQWLTTRDGHGAFEGVASVGDGPTEMRRLVRTSIERGVDFIKVMVTGGNPTLPTGVRAYVNSDEVRAIVDEAHAAGKLVAAHAHGGPGVASAVNAGVDTVEHGPWIADARVVELMARSGTAWTFNQGARMEQPGPPLSEVDQAAWDRTRAASMTAFAMARSAAIPIMVGADGHHVDHALVWAMEGLVKTGATPLEALVAATSTPARVLRLPGGNLQPGAIADLVVVDRDPLDDISALRSVRLVMKQGMVYRHVA